MTPVAWLTWRAISCDRTHRRSLESFVLMLSRCIKERDKDGKIVAYEFLFDGLPIPAGLRYCCRCLSLKESSLFSPGKTVSSCKECANKAARQNYHKRKATKDGKEKIQKQRSNTRERLLQYKKQAIEYMGGSCADCGGVFPPSVYDFHHLDKNEKEGNPSKFLQKGLEHAKKELSKCVLLCANCHRIRHFEGGYSDDRSY